jgi:hypothetical protein
MKHRKLRIAWSVAWGIVAMLLVALWVRSYFVSDRIYKADKFGQSLFGMTTGTLEISHALPQFRRPDQPNDTDGWVYESAPPTKMFESVLLRFRFKRNYSIVLVEIPAWLPPFILLMLSAAPWILLKRFSLRTLLIATTCVAVGLGLIVWRGSR